MPHPSRPSHAAPTYAAHVTPFDLQHESVRAARLSARQVAALAGLTAIPIAAATPGPFTATQQAELAIQDAVADVLKGRHVAAVLWRDPDLGDVSVWHDGEFLPIATVELTPVAEQVAA